MNDDDAWFEKVPGGYYKARAVPAQTGPQDSRDRGGYRRRSDEYDDRYDDEYDRRGDKRRDSHRNRSSYERDDRRYGNDRHRRSYDDYDDRSRQDRSAERRREQPDQYREPQSYRDDPQHEEPEEISPEAMRPEDIAAGGFAAGVAAAKLDQDAEQQYSGYVPYSHIYNNGGSETARDATFSPPPRDGVSSPQPHAMNQVSPPRRMSVAPEALYQDEHYPRQRAYDGNGEYDEDNRRSRPSRPRMSRLRSRSYDSYASRDGHSWRDPRNGRSGSPSRGKSQSRLNTTFDKSKRGLGYSAVGALAGGLVGSEYGGSVSTTIGAVLGGLGANMFEARERRKHIARDAEYVRDDELTGRREQRTQERRDSRSGSSWVG